MLDLLKLAQGALGSLHPLPLSGQHWSWYASLYWCQEGQFQFHTKVTSNWASLMSQATTPLWTLSAHSEAVTGISLSPHCPGIVSTVSQDKMLKVPFLFLLLSPEVEIISHRFGTSQGPNLLLLGSEALALAPFTLLPIVLMCLLSSPLGGTKPATTLRCPKWCSMLW